MAAHGQVFINEVLFNPPGIDTTNEYVELRGLPNFVLSNGTYLVAVSGNTNANPGTVQNVFDLSGRALGGNGFLVLLMKSHLYLPVLNSNATVLGNTNGPGFGSGTTSSIGHRGGGGQTDLENSSVTYLLLRAATPPKPGDEIDANNDGTPDGAVWSGWTVLDSVGILDNDGFGDIAYGRINYRRNAAPGSGATALTGTVVPVAFTPLYVGRTGNSTGSNSADWVASDNLTGSAPAWFLGGAANTQPSGYAGQPLNHLGSPNFGAPASNGVVAVYPGTGLVVREGASTNSYKLGLNTAPSGSVKIQIAAPPAVQISTDAGVTWGAVRSITFSATNKSNVLVRAPVDAVVDSSPHWAGLRHAITNTADATRYPTNALTPLVNVAILERDWLRLSELKVNPPGTNDGPWEFVELIGPPGALLSNVYFVALESSSLKNPGHSDLVVNLSGARLGTNGLLVLGGTQNPYRLAPGTALFGDARFDNPTNGALGNGPKTFLLVSAWKPIPEDADLDNGDNGKLEGLPDGTTVLDGVAFSDGSDTNVFYSAAVLELSGGLPDAATRWPGNTDAESADAWFFANLVGPNADSLVYDGDDTSPDFPRGTWLTPGAANNTAPIIQPLPAQTGVIGDATNPQVVFAVNDTETPVALLAVTAHSTNQAVVPDAGLVVTSGPGDLRTLRITPAGVGYTLITITVSDGTMAGEASFRYAASAMDRPGGHFHSMISDGSAAFAVDTNLMFIGDDENQVIRLYERHRSGPPLLGFDFTYHLNLTELYDNGLPKEMDIEGSARVGNRIYWLGSESNADTGAPHPNRNRIFASDLVGSGTGSQLVYVGRYEHLRDDILAWDANNLHGKGAHYYGLNAGAAPGVNPKEEDGSGFNLEGLTMAPGSTNVAYLGLRAPYVPATNRAKALIIVVTNFSALAISGAGAGAARFGPPIELNLIRRGIRSFEANSNAVLIVAGPAGQATGVSPADFKLFTWSGRSGNAPQERAADLWGLNPEAFVEPPPSPWSSNSVVQLISDNGIWEYYGDGVPAKRLPVPEFKKFRSDWVALGPVVTSKPIVRSVQNRAGQIAVSWYSVEGLTYRVQWTTNLHSGTWNNVPGDVVATDAISWKSWAVPALPNCFYRVIVP
ncbi:MAG: hypothetical protein HZA90_09520 [Verrucomicrobia bacterium]|nr:hypothetical protein [Verrucomicrobiota bacterium]